MAFVVGVVGNALVVFSLLVDRKSRNVTSSLLVSLAVADLVFLLVFVPYEAAVKMATTWVGGVILCKVSGFSEMLSAVASILNLTAVTVERWVLLFGSCLEIKIQLSRYFLKPRVKYLIFKKVHL